MSSFSDQRSTFESKFGAYIPEDTRVSNKEKDRADIAMHDDAGILAKMIAYIVDVGICVFVFPIIYNVYHYLKRGQTLGQKLMGIRIYRHHKVGVIATIPQLLTRFVIKMLFLAIWTIIGVNLLAVILSDWPGYASIIVYSIAMMICIHAYALNMIINKHRRGLHDVWAGTIVAYDHGYQLKQFILGVMLCAILYYIILGVGPQLLSWIDTHTSMMIESQYRSIWNWIDNYIITGMHKIGLQ